MDLHHKQCGAERWTRKKLAPAARFGEHLEDSHYTSAPGPRPTPRANQLSALEQTVEVWDGAE